jgi:hypothetical protein
MAPTLLLKSLRLVRLVRLGRLGRLVRLVPLLSAPLLLGAASACGGKSDPAADAPLATAATAPDPACLAKADAADGAVDKVVHKCPACGLAMDGKAEHASQIAGYALHSCSAGCKAALDQDPAGVLGQACQR